MKLKSNNYYNKSIGIGFITILIIIASSIIYNFINTFNKYTKHKK